MTGRFSLSNRILRPINRLGYTRQPSCIDRARYGELFISVPLFGFLGRASERHWRRELETPQRRARAYSPCGSCISRTPGMVRA